MVSIPMMEKKCWCSMPSIYLRNWQADNCAAYTIIVRVKSVGCRVKWFVLCATQSADCIVHRMLSPHSDRTGLVYVQNFNSPVVFLVFTKYVTMSCVGFRPAGYLGIPSWFYSVDFALLTLCIYKAVCKLFM